MKQTYRGWSWGVLLAGLLCCTAVTVAPTTDTLVPTPCRQRRFLPRLRHAPSKTANWAGYVTATNLAFPQKRSVTSVRGTWTVPVVAPAYSVDTASAIWVGIDGNSNRTVEQIGTEQDSTGGLVTYYAWFEMYPARGYLIQNFPVNPGDAITAEVLYVGKNRFQLSITNLTANVGFSIIKRRAAKRTSAEWIVEAPSSRHVLPLAEFGTTTFTDCSATIAGKTGPINDPAWQHEAFQMETATGVLQALPSTLADDGSGFSVTWHHN